MKGGREGRFPRPFGAERVALRKKAQAPCPLRPLGPGRQGRRLREFAARPWPPPFYLLGILSLPVQVQHFWPLATERKHMKEIGSLKKIPKEHNSPRQTLSLPILIKGIYMYRRHDLPLIWVALLSIPRPTSCGLSCFWSQYATSKHLGPRHAFLLADSVRRIRFLGGGTGKFHPLRPMELPVFSRRWKSSNRKRLAAKLPGQARFRTLPGSLVLPNRAICCLPGPCAGRGVCPICAVWPVGAIQGRVCGQRRRRKAVR